MSDVNRTATSEQGAKKQRQVANNQRMPKLNGAQQKCTRARDNTRKQNNATYDNNFPLNFNLITLTAKRCCK